MQVNIHATCLAFGAVGVLLRGASGSGKSTLALQLIDAPGYGLGSKSLRAKLVGDDQVLLTRQAGHLQATAPEALAGLIELRGLGLLKVSRRKSVVIKLVVDLVAEADVERLPQARDQEVEIHGVRLARVAIVRRHPAAAALVRAALLHLC